MADRHLVPRPLQPSPFGCLDFGTQELEQPVVDRLVAADQPNISSLYLLEQYADAGPCPTAALPASGSVCGNSNPLFSQAYAAIHPSNEVGKNPFEPLLS
jgi:hypothetical protein